MSAGAICDALPAFSPSFPLFAIQINLFQNRAAITLRSGQQLVREAIAEASVAEDHRSLLAPSSFFSALKKEKEEKPEL